MLTQNYLKQAGIVGLVLVTTNSILEIFELLLQAGHFTAREFCYLVNLQAYALAVSRYFSVVLLLVTMLFFVLSINPSKQSLSHGKT